MIISNEKQIFRSMKMVSINQSTFIYIALYNNPTVTNVLYNEIKKITQRENTHTAKSHKRQELNLTELQRIKNHFKKVGVKLGFKKPCVCRE